MKETIRVGTLTAAHAERLASVISKKKRFETFLRDHESGKRSVLIAMIDSEIVGYVTIVWESEYPPFRQQNIPEIKNLFVRQEFRRRKVATRLLDRAEQLISDKSDIAGIGVGLYRDYGPAQQLYALRGYVPDAQGVHYKDQPVEPGKTKPVDDHLTIQLFKKLDNTESRKKP